MASLDFSTYRQDKDQIFWKYDGVYLSFISALTRIYGMRSPPDYYQVSSSLDSVHEYHGYSYPEGMLRECRLINVHSDLLRIPTDAYRWLRKTYGAFYREPTVD